MTRMSTEIGCEAPIQRACAGERDAVDELLLEDALALVLGCRRLRTRDRA